MDGPQLVGRERAGVLDGAGRGHVELVDEHEHDVAAQDRRLGRRLGASCSSSAASASYWRFRRTSADDHDRDEDDDHPRAVR